MKGYFDKHAPQELIDRAKVNYLTNTYFNILNLYFRNTQKQEVLVLIPYSKECYGDFIFYSYVMVIV